MASAGGVLLQIAAVVASLAILFAGGVQLNDTGVFAVEWCGDDHNEACWTKNSNANLAMTFYSITVIGMGAFGVLAELGAAFVDRPAGYLAAAGLLSVATARNTGIVAGGFAALVGFIQGMLHLCGELPVGFVASEYRVPAWYIGITRFLSAIAMFGVMAVGGVALYSVSNDDSSDVDGDPLRWCKDETDRDCWLKSGPTTFALGAYGVALLLLGVIGFTGALSLWDRVRNLHRTSHLGGFSVVVGLLCLGAAGNTGIVVGVANVFLGLELLAFNVVFSGDTSINGFRSDYGSAMLYGSTA